MTSSSTSEYGARTGLPRPVARWMTWLAIIVFATALMYLVRSTLDKAHVTLMFLLVVLGASAAGGRALGLTVASLAFLSFDFFFLPPFATLSIANPLDWLVLIAFLVTSVVATQLLYRADATAEEANDRAREVDRLAGLGAETLNAADADEALRAIADVIRHSVDVDECDLYLRRADGTIHLVARAMRGADHAADDIRGVDELYEHGIAAWIIEHGTGAAELEDGTIRLPPDGRPDAASAPGVDTHGQSATVPALEMVTERDDDSLISRLRRSLLIGESPWTELAAPTVRAVAVPLTVRDRVVGVLRIATEGGLSLTIEQARLLTALAYYAALGAERARLVATAERAEAERRLEALRSALLMAVSHDLRTPLTTIKGIANEIVRGGDAARASVIEDEADRLDALVGDLLDLSRIHAGAVRPTAVVNTIDDLVGAALRAAAGATTGRRVETDLPSDTLLAGLFDFTQTLRILVNLIDNAAKYSPAGAPIEIRVRQANARLTVQVLDRGPGVPATERVRIFEPFYRPPGVPPDIRGYGLGLSIAHGLAEAQGGLLRFEPRPGGGSVFSLDLPAADLSLSAPQERTSGDPTA